MNFTLDANDWLGQVDPWGAREASELLQALEQGRAVGLFDCACAADGSRWYLMAPHAESVLLLPTPAAWRALAMEVRERYGLPSALPHGRELEGLPHDAALRAVNDSQIMPLLDQA